MDDSLREMLRTLATENSLDPEVFEAAFLSGDIPEELGEDMAEVLSRLGKAVDTLES